MLTNWYVRTSRDRFWNEDTRAFDTLYTALVTMAEVAAPLLPLLMEEIWRGLTGGRSVHLADWPKLPETVANPELIAQMDEVRDVVSAAHSLRKINKLRVRQPLRSLTLVTNLDLTPYTDLIATEVNVKNVRIADAESSGMRVMRDLTVLPRELAPAQRKMTSALFKAAREGRWEMAGDDVVLHTAPEVTLKPGQFTLATGVVAEEGSVATVLPSGAFVALDTELDPELLAEGYARDVVRVVQATRKAEGLHVADRITLKLQVPDQKVADVQKYLEFISAETLALDATVEGGGDTIVATVAKVETH
jgi:isoleucyl-tRNA synthetase